MFKYQLRRLFGKMWFLPFAFLIILIVTRIFALNRSHYLGELSNEIYSELDRLCAETEGMSLDERYAYISEIPYEQDSPRSEAAAEYRDQLVNVCYAVEGVKDYLNNGEGFRSINIPQDLNRYPELYKSLPEPQSINGIYFKRFLRIAGYDLTPIFVLLLVGAVVADSCEKGIDKQIHISRSRRSFYITRELTLVLTIVLMCVLTTLTDLAFSGLLFHPEYLSAPVQSIDHFVWLPVKMTLGSAVLWIFVMELLGALISNAIFIFIARRARDMKLYLLISAGAVSAISVASSRLAAVNLYGSMGINNKESILLNAQYLPSVNASTLVLPTAVLGGALLCICAIRAVRAGLCR